ncbi:Wrky dna-binding transcription factor [Thalictrum thalictroides]|uniref:Wrky dna-binding transcription factor n=1 Tax=Thalictrum thalictroides TaxID=46969 RepID=A0A7J6X0E6_THATH|nr:Wrky dna-binding transcription factor [Thalictrum thalictroides]
MENSKDYEQKPLINELTLAKELVNQLRFHLIPTSSTGEILIQKILSSYDKALLMLNWNNRSEAETFLPTPSVGMIESPQSGSPRSDDSDIRDIYKKRKTMPRWTEHVRVCSGTGTEGPQEDGHSWRKYGQKDILGAKYPRGYYRCTHRHVQGCLATKQVQRSDEDPLVFDVTYRGKHTCNPSSLLQASQALCKGDQTHNRDQLLEQRKRKQSEEMLQNFRAGLTVKTENPDTRELTSSPFSFPSITSTECLKSENNIFSPVSLENSYMGCYSPFISPATSESNYFSPCNIARKQPFRTSESDLNEIISAATSASNSPVMDLEFTLDSLDFDPNFPFDNNSFFS